MPLSKNASVSTALAAVAFAVKRNTSDFIQERI